MTEPLFETAARVGRSRTSSNDFKIINWLFVVASVVVVNVIDIDLKWRPRLNRYFIVFPRFRRKAECIIELISPRKDDAQGQQMIRLHPDFKVTPRDIGAVDWHIQSRLLSMARNENYCMVVLGRNVRHADGLATKRTAQWIARQIATRQCRRLIKKERSFANLSEANICRRYTGRRHVVCCDATSSEAAGCQHRYASQEAHCSSCCFHCGNNSCLTSILPLYALGIAHSFPFALDSTNRSDSDEAEYAMKYRAVRGMGK